MKIRVKLLFMVGVPIAALLIVSMLGLKDFRDIGSKVESVNVLHLERATMIDADRDAYQAQRALKDAISAGDVNDLNEAIQASTENLGQTWQRISEPSKNFTPNMAGDYTGFQNDYKQWKDGNVEAFQLISQTLETNNKRAEIKLEAIRLFDAMRDIIDVLGEMATDQAYEIGPQALSSILNADRDAYQAYLAMLLMDRSTTLQEIEEQAASYAENSAQTVDRVTKGANLLLGDEVAGLKSDFIVNYKAWNAKAEQYVQLTKEMFDDNSKKDSLIIQSDKSFSAMRDNIDRLGEAQAERVKAEIAKLNDIISDTTFIYIAVAVVFILAAIVIAVTLSSRISRALQESLGAATQIMNGNLDVSLKAKGNDETALLQSALNAMASTLRENIKEIHAKTAEAEDKAALAQQATHRAEEAMNRAEIAKVEGMLHAAERIETVVARVAEASQILSQQGEALQNGSTTQAQLIQNVATAMEEMNVTVLEVARNASEAAQSGTEAKNRAIEGAKVVRMSTEAMQTSVNEVDMLKGDMGKLDEQANGIGAIIGVINDIADQTNLLALNAAIEAARAGDAGRGFAVVADEVRKLAEKTMDATKEVSSSISAIQNVASANISAMENVYTSISETNEQSSKSGDMLDAIVRDSEASSIQIQSIATAADEQSVTTDEINLSIENINQVTIENARGVSESAAALNELAEQMAELKTIVEQLKTEGQSAAG